MHVSLRIRSLSDEELTFVKQIGVDYVDIGPPIVGEALSGGLPGFQKNRLRLDKVQEAIEKVRQAGLEVAAFVDFPPTRAILMKEPEADLLLQDFGDYIRLLGENQVPVSQLCLEMVRHGPGGVPGRYMRKHRGGYEMSAFSLARMREALASRDMNARWSHHFRDSLTFEEYFSRCVEICKRLAPIAEDSGVGLALHTDDPPVPDSEGLLPGITNPLLINRLFESVDSENLGLLFCCGTRYETGVDIFDQIRMFGEKGRIFHVHLRNVRGTLPSAGEYEEVSIDEGDMDMFRVLDTLDEVGYDGAVYPDHVPNLLGDESRRTALAFAVGYTKALMSVLGRG